MAYGIQTFNSDGSLQFSSDDRLSRIYGEYAVAVSANTTTDVSIPGVVNDGTWVVWPKPSTAGPLYYGIITGGVRIYNEWVDAGNIANFVLVRIS